MLPLRAVGSLVSFCGLLPRALRADLRAPEPPTDHRVVEGSGGGRRHGPGLAGRAVRR
jgi:hypothetical protein